MKLKLPERLRQKAEGQAVVVLSAKAIKELADYIEQLHKKLQEGK